MYAEMTTNFYMTVTVYETVAKRIAPNSAFNKTKFYPFEMVF